MTDTDVFRIDFRSVGDVAAMAPAVDLHIASLSRLWPRSGKVISPYLLAN
jgi:hypothetical protein